MIMHDILLDIIKGNEVSKIADRQIDSDKVANYLAEGILKNTVLRMLTNEVAEPLTTIAENEKSSLFKALIGDLESFQILKTMTQKVAKDSYNEEIARHYMEDNLQDGVIRKLLAEQIVGPALQQAGREQRKRMFQSFIEHSMHKILLIKAKQNLATL